MRNKNWTPEENALLIQNLADLKRQLKSETEAAKDA